MSAPFHPLRALAHHQDPLLAAGICAALQAAPGIEVVPTSKHSTFQDAEVVVCDYESGMEWAHQQRCSATAARRAPAVLVITWRDSEADVRAALQSGIGGYLLGNCALNELVEAVRSVNRGTPYLCEAAAARVAKSLTRASLTAREAQILQLIASGMPNKTIASELCIALSTVKAHVNAILEKLGAHSRTQATVIAAQRGLLASHSPLRPVSVQPVRKTTGIY